MRMIKIDRKRKELSIKNHTPQKRRQWFQQNYSRITHPLRSIHHTLRKNESKEPTFHQKPNSPNIKHINHASNSSTTSNSTTSPQHQPKKTQYHSQYQIKRKKEKKGERNQLSGPPSCATASTKRSWRSAVQRRRGLGSAVRTRLGPWISSEASCLWISPKNTLPFSPQFLSNETPMLNISYF